jgi:hypothetical protein
MINGSILIRVLIAVLGLLCVVEDSRRGIVVKLIYDWEGLGCLNC